MSRQYGIPPNTREDFASSQPPFVPPISPYGGQASRQFPQYPVPTQQSIARSPPRKPVGSYSPAPLSPRRQDSQTPASDLSGPPPPPKHRYVNSRQASGELAITGDLPVHTATPPQQLAYGGSDSQALRDIDQLYGGRLMSPSPAPEQPAYPSPYSQPRPRHRPTDSQSSTAPLRPNAASLGSNSPAPSHVERSGMPAAGMAGYGYGYDQNMPQGQSSRLAGYDDYVDPQDIADDGDDGFEDVSASRRQLFGGAAAGASASTAGPGMLKAFGARGASGNYGQIPGGGRDGDTEKSDWLQGQTGRNYRLKYIFGGLGILIICGIIAGVVGGVIASNPGSDKSAPASSSSSPSGAYTLHSSQVQAVMNNKNLHKVFPGMDYTPLNAQYPGCLTLPPNQDNITLDVAVLSQLTPAIRLYGTDCDQTQMVLTAIDRLEMNDTVKVWLGVWLENNATTNDRQLSQMYNILDKYPASHFAGVIVGNEVLFRKDMTAAQLGEILLTVRQNLQGKGIDLPVSTSDIGSAWTAAIAADSDIVMGNVHPFFAGVTATEAASWTWDFWQNNDVVLAGSAYGSYPKSIVSETGWPSQGGNDCGTGEKCPTSTQGAIAGIDEMNTFMEGWVCQSLANGTTYFWFEAFDQPWTVIFDDPTTGDYWEPHWGLMDVNRNIKPGVQIPDCGGQTISKFY